MFIRNTTSSPLPLTYVASGKDFEVQIPVASSVEVPNDAVLAPGSTNLLAKGWLLIVNQPLQQTPFYPSKASSLYYFGPWLAGSILKAGYLVSYGSILWRSLSNHNAVIPPSNVNADFEPFNSDGVAAGFTAAVATATAGMGIFFDGTNWAASKVSDDQVSAISQSKVTDLVAALEGKLSTAGGTMTGPLILPATAPNSNHAIRRDFADAAYLKLIGGTVTGLVSCALVPTNPHHLTNKAYVDSVIGLPLTGGTLTGQLQLPSGVQTGLQALSRQSADTLFLAKSGGTVSGSIVQTATPTLNGHLVNVAWVLSLISTGFTAGPIESIAPTDPAHLTTKAYVDNLDISGKTISTPISFSGTPTLGPHLINKTFADANYLKLSGGTLSSAVSWAGTPSLSGHLVNKTYVDTVALLKTGGTVTGKIVCAIEPTNTGDLTNKAYVDTALTTRLATSGGTLIGAVSWSGVPSANGHLANKEYVDGSVVAGIEAAVSVMIVRSVDDGLPTSFVGDRMVVTGSLDSGSGAVVFGTLDAGYTRIDGVTEYSFQAEVEGVSYSLQVNDITDPLIPVLLAKWIGTGLDIEDLSWVPVSPATGTPSVSLTPPVPCDPEATILGQEMVYGDGEGPFRLFKAIRTGTETIWWELTGEPI